MYADSRMTHTSSATLLESFQRSAPTEMEARMFEAARLHRKLSEFRDNAPEMLGDDAAYKPRIKDRYSLYLS